MQNIWKIIKIYFLFLPLLLVGCVFQSDEVKLKGLDLKNIGKGAKSDEIGEAKVTLSSVSILNHQLILQGTGLDQVKSIKIKNDSNFEESFSIESKSETNLVANGLRNISFALENIFDLMITDAYGAATFQVTFTLQDGAVTASKLSDMGASIGQVLKYDGSTWIPSDLGSLTYAGNWNATSNSPDLTGGGSNGEYHIVDVAGNFDLSGGDGTNSWQVGDWVIWNNVLGQWEKINNGTNVTSFNSRNGPVTPQTGDYTWAMIDKSTSSIGDVNDVDLSSAPSNGQVLKFNGTNWVAATDNDSGVSTNSVTSAAISDGSIVNADNQCFCRYRLFKT